LRKTGGRGGIGRVAALVEDMPRHDGGLRLIGHGIAKHGLAGAWGGAVAQPEQLVAHVMGDTAASKQGKSSGGERTKTVLQDEGP
jgi:hypothetical protein